MRILVLNWRDVRSPRAGGAEVLTHEIARRLAGWGHEVTWFTSRPPGLAAEERVDGVDVVRVGSELTTRLRAPRFARASSWDVVVEEINTLPWLSPKWSRAPVVLFMAQLAREVWWYEAPKLVAPFGYAAEPSYLRAYRRVPKITISLSTRDDLLELGLDGPIHVLPMAVHTPALASLPPKPPCARLVTVGRLVPSKRVDQAIKALSVLRRDRPEATLTVVGGGPEEDRLRRLAAGQGVAEAVAFRGRVDEEEKTRLIRDADLLVACSAREGWGLTVTEAARLGTPAVAYDVPGLRDSIVSERTGLLTAVSPEALAAGADWALADRGLYERLRSGAWERSRDLSWEKTARAFERALPASLSG